MLKKATITYAACGEEGTGARGCRYSTLQRGRCTHNTVFLFFWKLVAQALLAGCGRQRCRASTLPIREAGGSPVALDCKSVARRAKRDERFIRVVNVHLLIRSPPRDTRQRHETPIAVSIAWLCRCPWSVSLSPLSRLALSRQSNHARVAVTKAWTRVDRVVSS